jgi:hypothetical protein
MPSGKTPASITADLIRAYALHATMNYGEDEAPIALLTAIVESNGPEETCHLGAALLAREDGLSDPPYRLGGEMCDPRKTEIATRLRYA